MTNEKAKKLSNIINTTVLMLFTAVICLMLLSIIAKIDKKEKEMILIISISLVILTIILAITSYLILKKAEKDKETTRTSKSITQEKTSIIKEKQLQTNSNEENKTIQKTVIVKKKKQQNAIKIDENLIIKILQIIKIILFSVFAMCTILTIILYLTILLSYFAIIPGVIAVISLAFAFYTDKKIEIRKLKIIIIDLTNSNKDIKFDKIK